MPKKIILISVLSFFLPVISIHSAEINLKSGGIVSGDILSQDSKGYKVKVKWGEVYVEKELVNSISGIEDITFKEAEDLFKKKDYPSYINKVEEILTNGLDRNSSFYSSLISCLGEIYCDTLDYKMLSGLVEKFPDIKNDLENKIFVIADGISITSQEASAVPIFQAFTRDFPSNANRPGLLFKVAEYCFKVGDYDTAIEDYLIILELYPTSADKEAASFKLGQAYLKRENFDEGIKQLNKAKQMFPQSKFINESDFLVFAYSKYNDPNEKIDKLFEFIKSNPDSPTIPSAIELLDKYLEESKDAKKYDDKIKNLLSINVYGLSTEPSNRLKYLIAKSKVDYLKELVDQKRWNEYSAAKNSYETDINETLGNIIKSSKDPLLVVDASYLMLYFDNVFHNPREKADFDNLKKALSEYTRSTSDFNKIKKIAKKFYDYKFYAYAKELYILYAIEIMNKATNVESLAGIIGLINESSVDMDSKTNFLSDLLDIYFSGLLKFKTQEDAVRELANIGEFNIENGNCYAAKAIYEMLLKDNRAALLDKDFYNLAVCYDNQNKTDKAVYYYNETLTNFPSNPYSKKINTRLAKFLRTNDEYEKAIPYYEALFDGVEGPDSLESQFNELISMYFHLGKYDKLVSFLGFIIDKYKGTRLALIAKYQLGYYYYHLGNNNKAVELFKDISLLPDDGVYVPSAVEMLSILGV